MGSIVLVDLWSALVHWDDRAWQSMPSPRRFSSRDQERGVSDKQHRYKINSSVAGAAQPLLPNFLLYEHSYMDQLGSRACRCSPSRTIVSGKPQRRFPCFSLKGLQFRGSFPCGKRSVLPVSAKVWPGSLFIRTSTHFHRSVIHAGTEFESRMSDLFASLPARIGDSGY
jgi:hypothetical protein